MKKILVFPILLIVLVFASCNEEMQETQTVNLQIDGYSDGGNKNFVETTISGTEIAISLGTVSNTFQVTFINFLFGGAGNTPTNREIILKIYKENGAIDPGTLLYSSNYTVSSSNTVMQTLDISDKSVTVSGGGSIRVSFEMTDEIGFPSFAQEFDGIYLDTKNWVKDPIGTWKSSDTFGLNGNWVIRATVEESI